MWEFGGWRGAIWGLMGWNKSVYVLGKERKGKGTDGEGRKSRVSFFLFVH